MRLYGGVDIRASRTPSELYVFQSAQMIMSDELSSSKAIVPVGQARSNVVGQPVADKSETVALAIVRELVLSDGLSDRSRLALVRELGDIQQRDQNYQLRRVAIRSSAALATLFSAGSLIALLVEAPFLICVIFLALAAAALAGCLVLAGGGTVEFSEVMDGVTRMVQGSSGEKKETEE